MVILSGQKGKETQGHDSNKYSMAHLSSAQKVVATSEALCC